MADRLGADPPVMRQLALASPDNKLSTFFVVWRRIAGAPQTVAIGIGGVLGLLTVTPLAILLVGSFRPDGLPATPGWTLEHYIDVWGSAYDWQLVANTLLFSGASTILAVTLATALSWLLERTDLPARDLFRAMILMPMATPPSAACYRLGAAARAPHRHRLGGAATAHRPDRPLVRYLQHAGRHSGPGARLRTDIGPHALAGDPRP